MIGVAVRDDDVFEVGDFFADRFDRRDDFVRAARQSSVDERQLALIEEKNVDSCRGRLARDLRRFG
jgi:hypothetical protein